MNFALEEQDPELAMALALSFQSSSLPTSSSSSSSTTSSTSSTVSSSSPSKKKLKLNQNQETKLHLQVPGYSTIVTLPNFVRADGRHFDSIQVEHGSSLSLISRGTSILNDEFSNIDPSKNWGKFKKIGMQPYFVAVIRPSNEGCAKTGNKGNEILSILSFIMDGDVESGAVLDNDSIGHRTRRIVIDYVCTPKAHQGKGYASRLLNLVNEVAIRHRSNMFVLSLEESCPYWMNKGFILESGLINKRLNKFPDCHLLKQPSNLIDDFVLPPSDPDDDDDDNEDDEDDEDDEEDEEEEEEKDEEEATLQNAIAASLASISSSSNKTYSTIDLTAEGDDTDLQRAIAASMNQ
jgi:hypothetical protein